MTKSEQYTAVNKRITALLTGETDVISMMATLSCELFHRFKDFDWVGFYRNVGNGSLKVGPYQGGHGCTTISFDRGICGKCATTREVQLVPDVHAVPEHIACSSSTCSEIVLPVFDENDELMAVLDIDSDQPAAFDETDQRCLMELLEIFRQVSF